MNTDWPEPIDLDVAVGEETQHIPCDEKDCPERPTIHCEFPDGADGGYYCSKHAKGAGFCYGCGQFWAGIESFDFARAFGHVDGLCENCDDQLKSELGEGDYDDEPDPEYWDESDFAAAEALDPSLVNGNQPNERGG